MFGHPHVYSRQISDLVYSSLDFFLTILLTKWMHYLFLISTGRQPHAFEEELLVRRPVYYLGSGGGTDRRSAGSKHENFLSTVYAFQRCSAFPDANTADEDIPRRQAFCGPLTLLAFAGWKYACWMKIRRYNSGTHMYCIYITVLLRGEDENRNQNSDYTFLVWHFVLTEMRVRRYLISVRSCYNVVNSTR